MSLKNKDVTMKEIENAFGRLENGIGLVESACRNDERFGIVM